MKNCLFLVLLACSAPAFAQAETLNPPMTREEQKSMEQMQQQYRKAGLPTLTDEQIIEMVGKIRAMRVDATARIMAAQQVATSGGLAFGATARPRGFAPTPSALPTISQATLAAQIKAQNASPGFVRFEQSREGFTYDGKVMVEVEGEITDFGANAATGEVCYVVSVVPGRSLLKYRNVRSSLPST